MLTLVSSTFFKTAVELASPNRPTSVLPEKFDVNPLITNPAPLNVPAYELVAFVPTGTKPVVVFHIPKELLSSDMLILLARV